MQNLFHIFLLQFSHNVTVHALHDQQRICRGFAFKYGKFPLPLRYRTALSVPKVPIMYSNKSFVRCHSVLHVL